tara:strand:- start:793 stop:1065 length:273 start_codon:yes stop_codon:yes gene_type:complete
LLLLGIKSFKTKLTISKVIEIWTTLEIQQSLSLLDSKLTYITATRQKKKWVQPQPRDTFYEEGSQRHYTYFSAFSVLLLLCNFVQTFPIQ